MYSKTHFSKAALHALIASSAIVTLLFATFFLAEPTVSRGQSDTATFYIRQQITGESSFLVNPSNINMVGSIAGVTGGQATGTTQFVVTSNNSSGYYVDIAFFDNGTEQAMLGESTASESLRDYTGSTTEPSRGYVASTSAQFAYTVTSSTTADTDASFFHDGSTCNAGGSQTVTCWMTPTTSAFRIVDRTTSAVSGATSTLTFNVTVPSGANPVPVADFYTATATLSLYDK